MDVMGQQNIFNIHDEFFIIDSEQLETVKTKFYGYAIVNSMIVEYEEDLADAIPRGEGAYVYIRRQDDKIVVYQDFVGCYGLYLFRNNDYFALSNSFHLLVDHVKQKYPLSLNRDYANSLLVSDLVAVAYSKTMVEEIEVLDRNAVVTIDIPQKVFEIQFIDYCENTVSLNSEEGIAILDSWYHKWTAFIKNIKNETNNIQTDLSGGFDSRMTLTLLLGSGIDLNDIYIHSLDDDLHTHAEDFEIASAISRHYNFQLNDKSNLSVKSNVYTLEDILHVSFYTKLSFHKQMYWKYSRMNPSRHYFGGSGGESMRCYWEKSEQEYIDENIRRCRNIFSKDSKPFETSVQKLLTDSFKRIKEKAEMTGRTIDADEVTRMLYRETRCRDHFGKDVVENYFAGAIKYTPLLDPELQKLKRNDDGCRDKNLLMTVIFDRYNRDLLSFKFEGGRSIAAETIQYARRINEKFPYTKAENNCCVQHTKKRNVKSTSTGSDNKRVSLSEVTEAVEKAFWAKKTRGIFETVYDESIYEYVANDIKTRKYHPLTNAYAVLGICRIIQDSLATESMSGCFLAEHIHSRAGEEAASGGQLDTLHRHSYLENYITARIDIKNMLLASNAIEIIEISDENAKVTSPQWFASNGQGRVLESQSGRLAITFRCIRSGKLTIDLRGKDVRDKDKNRIPFWIDFTRLQINGEEQLTGVCPVWHDKPYRYSKLVRHDEEIRLYVEWEPHDERMNRVQ